jgi:hypothetical protein
MLCLRRVHEELPSSWDWTGAAAATQRVTEGGRTGSTSELLEHSDLQVTYFALLSALVASDLLHLVPRGDALSLSMSALVLVRPSAMHARRYHPHAAPLHLHTCRGSSLWA